MVTLTVVTTAPTELIDITSLLVDAASACGVRHGAIVVFVPHTTAGVTINENTDPAVRDDLLMALDRAVPADLHYRHAEGNSDAHVKASLVGSSVIVPVHDGTLQLGTWQGVYFAEFDGPRRRRVVVTPLAAPSAPAPARSDA
jgi:secondary thiamine-phosphate synthase enzyme